MGCISSKKGFVANENIDGQSKSAMEVFMTIGLRNTDLDKFYYAFNQIDADKSNSIRAIELFTYFNIELGVFERHVFGVFDEDKSGVLNFMEFVCSMWNLLTLGDRDLGILAYLMKDPTGAMRIKYNDVKDLMEIMHKKKIESSPALTNLYTNLKKVCPSEISITDFCNWTAANSTVLSPLLILQLKLRKQVIGEGFWLKMTRDRADNPDLGDHGFVQQLQALLKRKNAEFKNRRIDAEMVRLRERKSGGDKDKAKKNVARKESVLLGAFGMKQKPDPRAVAVTNTTTDIIRPRSDTFNTDMSKSSNSIRTKPQSFSIKEPSSGHTSPVPVVAQNNKKMSRDNNKPRDSTVNPPPSLQQQQQQKTPKNKRNTTVSK